MSGATSAAAGPIPLTGSSTPTGAPPSFTPVASAPAAPAAAADQGCCPALDGETPAFRAAARAWAASSCRLDAAIDAVTEGRAQEGTLDAIADEHAARRIAFLDTPASTTDGALARAMVLCSYIQTEDDPLRACFDALRSATLNTQEANYAFSVVADLGAMVEARGMTVEALAALPADLPDLARDEVAELTAEWLRTGSVDRYSGDIINDMPSRDPRHTPTLEWAIATAESNRAVLRRIAALESTSPGALALKVAVVLQDVQGLGGLEREIGRTDGTELCDAEVGVALSIVRDLAAAYDGEVDRLLTAISDGVAALAADGVGPTSRSAA